MYKFLTVDKYNKPLIVLEQNKDLLYLLTLFSKTIEYVQQWLATKCSCPGKYLYPQEQITNLIYKT